MDTPPESKSDFLATTLADGKVFGFRIASVVSYKAVDTDQTEVSFAGGNSVTIALAPTKFVARLKAAS